MRGCAVALRYRELAPPPALLRHVECVWIVSDDRARQNRTSDRVVPDGCPELIVHLGDVFSRLHGGRWRAQPRSFLAGTLTRPWRLRAGRRVDTLGVRFRAGEVTAVFPVSLAQTSDREIRLGALVDLRAARALPRALRCARTDDARVVIAGRWLGERLAEAAPSRTSARPAVERILGSRGQERIDDVARALGWSRRRMERVFARELGVTPKVYARIVRLNAVLATLDEDERPRAIDQALDAGYFDQAHLLRDFRLLAGRTPHAPRQEDGEMARHFTHPQRLRALLRGD
jgi:AraC-like DNA-binding protein